jgi:hypothetical protein
VCGQQPIDCVANGGHFRVVEFAHGEHRRETGGGQQPVLIAEQQIEFVGEARALGSIGLPT